MVFSKTRRVINAILVLLLALACGVTAAFASEINLDDLPKNAADVGTVFQAEPIVAVVRVESISQYSFTDETGQEVSTDDSSGAYLAQVKLSVEQILRGSDIEVPLEMIEMCRLKQDARYIIGLGKRDPERPGSTGYEKGTYTITRAMRINDQNQILNYDATYNSSVDSLGAPICTLEEAVLAIASSAAPAAPQTPKPVVAYQLDGRRVYAAVAAKSAYVYASANTSAKKLLVVGKGDALLLSGSSVVNGGKRYVRVVLYDGDRGAAYGYIRENCIAMGKDNKAIARTPLYQSKCTLGTVGVSRYVYAETNTKSARIGVLRKGTALAIATPMIGNWYKVNVGGQVGYIPSKSISVLFDEEDPNA